MSYPCERANDQMPMTSDVCAKCGSMNLSDSHRRGWIERWILTFFGIVPIRCMDCGTRFYSFRRPLY